MTPSRHSDPVLSQLRLHAIADRMDAPLPLNVGGIHICFVPHRELVAIASPMSDAHEKPIHAAVQRHEQVIEAVMAASTVLPLRWGTVLRGETRIHEVLRTHYNAFRAALDRVRGRVELGLRVFWAGERGGTLQITSQTDDGETAASGGRYLLARMGEGRRADAQRQRAIGIAQRIHGPLSALAAAQTIQVLPTPRTLLKAAYLVDRGSVESVRRHTERLAAAFPHLSILLTGPWPAYHFVTDCVLPTWQVDGDGEKLL